MMYKFSSGHYKPEENKTCDKCGVAIGDYTNYEGVIRCVGCWIEYDIDQFDDAFPDGVFAIERSEEEPRVKVRALFDYCNQNKILPKDLTSEEKARFLIFNKEKKRNWGGKI